MQACCWRLLRWGTRWKERTQGVALLLWEIFPSKVGPCHCQGWLAMDTKFSDGQAGVDALTSSLNTRMHAQAAGQGTAGASLRPLGALGRGDEALRQAWGRRGTEPPRAAPPSCLLPWPAPSASAAPALLLAACRGRARAGGGCVLSPGDGRPLTGALLPRNRHGAPAPQDGEPPASCPYRQCSWQPLRCRQLDVNRHLAVALVARTHSFLLS